MNEREKQSLITERERQNTAIRTLEANLHKMELRERDLANELREKSSLEERIEVTKKEIVAFTGRLKVQRSITLENPYD